MRGFVNCVIALCAAAILAGCGGAQLPTTLVLPSAHPDRTIVVRPGQSIQAAVDRAQSGDRIVVEPGTYREAGRSCPFDSQQTCAVTVTKDAISLVARGGKHRVLLLNSEGLTNGIAVGRSSDCTERVNGSRVDGFTVKSFAGSGVALICTDRWELGYDGAFNNALYGFYASLAGFGRIHDSVAENSANAGFHVSLSHDVELDHNVAHANVIGFELREMVRANLENNTAFYNTAAIFESIQVGDPLERSRENVIGHNVVQNNNRPNKCAKPSDPVCLVAPGVGIAVIGGTRNISAGNRVVGNKTFGIAVLDVCTAFQIPESKCDRLGFDPLPRDTHTVRNIALQNGVDLLWTANGSGNCWLKNRSKVRVPPSLPRCSADGPAEW